MAEPGTRVVEPNLPASAELSAGGAAPVRRVRWLFALAVTAGVALTAVGIVRSGHESPRLPAGAVARVGDAVIARAEYERTLEALARDRKTPLTAADRAHALQRLIDEELLLQRALELDLARTDLRARRALVSAVVDSVVTAQEAAELDDTELRRFYESNRDWFTGPDLFRIRQIWFRVESAEDSPAAEARARAAYERLRHGEPFELVRQSAGDHGALPLPDSLLPAAKVAELLGPTVLRAVTELPAGGISPPVRSGTGFHILQLIERRSGEPPPFEEIRPQVANEFRRRAADQALRTYLDELRSRSTIVLSPDVARDTTVAP